MAWRFRLAPEHTNINFFRHQWLTFGGSMLLTVVAILLWAVMGLNFGIDFRGGTTIRTEATQPVDVAAYREALSSLELGDVAITEVFDPSFRDDQHVAQIRIAPGDTATLQRNLIRSHCCSQESLLKNLKRSRPN